MPETHDENTQDTDAVLAGIVGEVNDAEVIQTGEVVEAKTTKKSAEVSKKSVKKTDKKKIELETVIPISEPFIDKLDPRDEFLNILKQMGITRGIEVVADVFLNGNIDDASWLDSTLLLANINKKNRELILTRYYGQPFDELGVKLRDNIKGNVKHSSDSSDTGEFDVSQMMKEQFKSAKDMQMMNQLIDMNKAMNKSSDASPVNEYVEEIPLFNTDGSPTIDSTTGLQAVKRIISKGQSAQRPDSSMQMMSAMFQNMLTQNNKSGDSSAKEMMLEFSNKFTELQASQVAESNRLELLRAQDRFDEERRRNQDDVRRLEDKHKEDLQRAKDDNDKNLDNLAKSMNDKIESVQESYKRDLDHREMIDEVQSMFGKKITDLEADLNRTSTDIKSTVIKEGLKQSNQIVNQANSTIGAFVTPMADIMKNMYANSMNQMQQTVAQSEVPDTTNEELQELYKN